MSEEVPVAEAVDAPKAVIRKKKEISIVWLVPLVALVIGGYLAYKAFTEQGPLVSISFSSAEGLEEGKTKIKFKDVEIGMVEEIHIQDDLQGVLVEARMTPEAKRFLTDRSRFWIVRARISANEVAALGTLLSGAYISIDPVLEGESIRNFVGLEKPPLVTTDLPGRQYLLRSEVLGSLNIGSPVFYRQIKVGEVVDFGFAKDGETVEIQVFIHAPHHKRVQTNTRFWNASGFDVTLDAGGVKIDSQSLASILQGGVVFANLPSLENGAPAEQGHTFVLHPDQESARQRDYRLKEYYVMYFDQSVRGLVPGAPVEFRGIPIGEVVDVRLTMDIEDFDVRIPVLVKIEPERIDYRSAGVPVDMTFQESDPNENRMIQRGLRAQLKTGNLLTGKLYIDLDIFPDAEPVEVSQAGPYRVFPTIPAPLGRITESLTRVLKKLEAVPFTEIGEGLDEALDELQETLGGLKQLVASFDQKVVPSLDQTLKGLGSAAAKVDSQILPDLNAALIKLNITLDDLRDSLGTDSALNHNAKIMLQELTGTVRSVRSLADRIDRNPQALIFGRDKEEQ